MKTVVDNVVSLARGVDRLGIVDQIGDLRRFHIRKEARLNGKRVRGFFRHGGKRFGVRAKIVVNRETELLEIVRALHAARGFTRRLDRWEEQSDKNSDNCNDDEEFNERKSSARRAGSPPRRKVKTFH